MGSTLVFGERDQVCSGDGDDVISDLGALYVLAWSGNDRVVVADDSRAFSTQVFEGGGDDRISVGDLGSGTAASAPTPA